MSVWLGIHWTRSDLIWLWFGSGLILVWLPGQSADVSHTVEDSEHGETDTWNPQHTGTLTHRQVVTMETDRQLPWMQTDRLLPRELTRTEQKTPRTKQMMKPFILVPHASVDA